MFKQHFLAKLNEIFAAKTNAGEKEVTITSGELHRLLGGYPGTNHRMPICCAAMPTARYPRNICKECDKIVIRNELYPF